MQLQQLIIESQQGNQRSYQEFLIEIEKRARNFLKLRISKEEIVDEIIQEVLLGIHRSLHTYMEHRPVMPWIMSIIKFKLTDYFRKIRKDEDPFEEDMHESISTDLVFFKEVLSMLNDLPLNQGELIRMVKVEGYSIDEMATQTGLTHSNIKINIHRGVKKLRRMLSE